MSRDETALELEKLRADVAALKEAKETAQQTDEPHTESTGAADTSTGPAGPAESAEAMATKVQGQIEELSSLLEAEIHEHPTVTTLAVFTLGILIGRMLR